MELELRLAVGHRCALLVLGDEAEVRLADQGGSGGVRACWRVDPAASGHEPAARVVDHDVLSGSALCRRTCAVRDDDADLVHAGRRILVGAGDGSCRTVADAAGRRGPVVPVPHGRVSVTRVRVGEGAVRCHHRVHGHEGRRDAHGRDRRRSVPGVARGVRRGGFAGVTGGVDGGAGGGAGVGVCARDGCTGGLEDPDLRDVERAAVVRVADVVDAVRAEHRHRCDARIGVGHGDVAQYPCASDLGDRVAPRDRRTGRDGQAVTGRRTVDRHLVDEDLRAPSRCTTSCRKRWSCGSGRRSRCRRR